MGCGASAEAAESTRTHVATLSARYECCVSPIASPRRCATDGDSGSVSESAASDSLRGLPAGLVSLVQISGSDDDDDDDDGEGIVLPGHDAASVSSPSAAHLDTIKRLRAAEVSLTSPMCTPGQSRTVTPQHASLAAAGADAPDGKPPHRVDTCASLGGILVAVPGSSRDTKM